jgi:thiol-disulfide isomerase/thioredoxin
MRPARPRVPDQSCRYPEKSKAFLISALLMIIALEPLDLFAQPFGKEWIGREAPELCPGDWINAEAATLRELRGKVVLIEFWTFGCYNCRNTLPYVKSWHRSFSPDKFLIIGVHTPEFPREEDLNNVRDQVKKLGIEFAVVTDNDFETWRAYHQQYWPVMYLLDKQGVIRNVQIGEGGYERMEALIGELIGKPWTEK